MSMQGNRQDAQTDTHKADPGGNSRGCPSVISEAGDELAGAAITSMRVVWTREDQQLYKEVLKQHGRSMQHLCAAFPNKCAALSPHHTSCQLSMLSQYEDSLTREEKSWSIDVHSRPWPLHAAPLQRLHLGDSSMPFHG